MKILYSETKFLFIWCFTVLAFKWFFNEIAYYLFLGIFLPIGFIYIWTAFVFVKLIIFLFQKIKTYRIKAIFPLLVFLVIISVFCFVPFKMPRIKLEHLLYKNARNEITADIRESNYSDGSCYNLTGLSKFTSLGGEVLVYENSDDRIAVGFFVYKNHLSAPSATVIYSSDGNFDDTDFNHQYSSHYSLEFVELEENWRYYYPIKIK